MIFKKTLLDFKTSGTLNQLVFDYLEQKDTLKEFYNYFPDRKGFKELLTTNPYTSLDRNTLHDVLLTQSQLVKNSKELTLENIAQLRNKDTFTITTGHQLCLFTGPLYFIYKIFSAINLAEALKKQFPEYHFVPVYWMASEDHDFEEVSSFNTGGRTVKWKSEQSGAVGKFNPRELKQLMPSVREALGISENANYLYTLFENAYLNHDTLSAATLYLVNELFGKYGLVTIDGDDKILKGQIGKLLRTDLIDHAPELIVRDTIKKLENLGYSAQVNPRNINCFYLEKGLRVRIEKTGELYNLVGTERSFTTNEINEIIDKTPEKLSPNVVLRPVYQQHILPNIAYVGGPGELAYWLEFKAMFDQLNVFFPILMPRNFISVIDRLSKTKIDQLNFFDHDFFKSEQELIKEFMLRRNQVFAMTAEEEKLKLLFAEIESRTNLIDKTLSGNVGAELQRSLKRISSISDKMNKALKRQSETELNRIKSVKQKLFPEGIPQERYENFSSLYIQYGPAFFEVLKTNIDPFLSAHNILIEE